MALTVLRRACLTASLRAMLKIPMPFSPLVIRC